ncbi:hypothetical protein HI146_RS23945 [Escherichia coli]|nr:hypothetical protein [Escherichia coli]EGE6127006.1 hypothetical protein [Escherichia coli]
MATKINTIMLNLVSFREEMKDLPAETVRIHIAAYRELIAMLPLKREQYAATAMLDAMIHKMIQTDLTMAYQYMGEMFAVYSKPVPGMESTEVLHGLNLKQDAWDNMPRFLVWADSGKIYE